MNQGARVQVNWVDMPPIETAAPSDLAPQELIDSDAGAPEGRRGLWVAAALGLLALIWVAGLTWALALAAPDAPGQPLRLLAWIGLASAPLTLLAALAVLLLRTGGIEASAYGRAAAQLRADTRMLQATLGGLNRHIAAARGELAAHAGELQRLGQDAGTRVARAAADLGAQGEAFVRTAAALDDATATARADLGVLLSDLPQAEAIARAMADGLRNSGAEADAHARSLAQLLEQLAGRARSAGDASNAASSRLTIQLDRIEESAAAADQRIVEAAGTMGRAVDAALGAVTEGVEETRHAVAGQSRALTALVEQSRAALSGAGDDALRALSARIDELVVRVDGIGAGLRGQELAARGLLGQLDQAIGMVEDRFAALSDKGAEHTADLAEAIVTLSEHAEAVGRTLGGSAHTAETLLGRVSQLRTQADASGVTLGDTIPTALSRVRLHAEQSLQTISAAGQRTEELARSAGEISQRLSDADTLLDRQRTALGEVGGEADSRLRQLQQHTASLEDMLRRASTEVATLSDGASTRLVEVLDQVRQTAAQASEEARDALSSAIPRVAQRLGESATRSLTAAIAEVGKTEMASIEAASEQAIDAARAAAERLSRQLLTIAETTTAIQGRIDANAQDTEGHDDQSFARTTGLLIEALNSTAIDVAKIFSNEVSDEEWKAYLRGDRGIFTRRAVKLIDRADCNAIVQRYNEESEFREQINRYIHDFEALIRRVMAVREGTSMATAMLSSDTGKLYVALAQAIERLRK
ncbi:hypothetical protein [uncultured Sphingomonas sp.]|uniref:hypothetical protein n=1 Tax=uncultured Sphingomonas sp. TaxID=158754 RepID=UPI0025FE1452|nr:hypothetical protein [uncultured Sphingomonas sp.]